MRLVYITLARKILCYGSFPAKVLLGTNAYNSLILLGHCVGKVNGYIEIIFFPLLHVFVLM